MPSIPRFGSLALGAVALTLALGGCTITTHSADPAVPPAPPAPGQPPAPQPTQATPAARRPFLRPTVRPVPATVTAPVVTGNTVFGGPTKKAFRGLAYVIPETTTRMPNVAALVPFAQLYTDRFAVASQEFAGGFPGALQQDEWFAIRYEGPFELPTDGIWTFKLASDDGAVLYIDGKRVIDNDGVHTERSNTAQVELKGGGHTLRLDYFQAKKGPVALRLDMVVGGQDRPLIGVR